jgi:16S rRNA (uracil1498-N3)-methyltransferase
VLTPRVFVGSHDRALRVGDDYRLPPAPARHIVQALRMRVGDALALFDGTGGEYECRLVRIERDDVVVHIETHVPTERESTWPVVLAQAVIASDMMDLVVRKAVELGVAAISPFYADRSQRAPPEREGRRLAHWQNIASAACEQCGRNRVPEVMPIVDFDASIERLPRDTVVVLDADAPFSIAKRVSDRPPAAIIVGPEGGLTREEVARAERNGALRAHLGNRVLRAETAALAALAIIDAIGTEDSSS